MVRLGLGLIFTNETAGEGICYPIEINGLFDLSIQNVTPENFRNWIVGVFALIFSVLFAVIMVMMTNSVSKYGKRVWTRQLLHAPGYRTVLVKGLKVPEVKKEGEAQDEETKDLPLFSLENFKKAYLSATVYFPNPKEDHVNIGGCIIGKEEITCDGTALFASCNAADGLATTVTDVVFDREIPGDLEDLWNDYIACRNALQDSVAAERVFHREMKHDRTKAYALLREKGQTIPEKWTTDTDLPPLMGRPLPAVCCAVPIVEHNKEKSPPRRPSLRLSSPLCPLREDTGTPRLLELGAFPCGYRPSFWAPSSSPRFWVSAAPLSATTTDSTSTFPSASTSLSH